MLHGIMKDGEGAFYVTHASRAIQSHDLSGERINFGPHITFLTTQGHGGPSRLSDHLNAGATSEKTNIKDDTHHSPSHLF